MILARGGPMTRVERVGLGVAILLAAALMVPVGAYVTDSSYVGLRYAENLARGHGLVFNPGERVYGWTSPLWAALVADGIVLGFDALAVARAIGIAATLASVGLFLQLMRRTVRSPVVRAAATIAWSAHPWMLQWSCSGLETPLAAALVLAGFVAFTEGETWGARPVRAGSLWALAALTRPGGVLLVVLWATVLIVDADNRQAIRRLVFGVAPGLVIYGSWLMFARLYYGTFWPQTLSLAVEEPVGWAASFAHLLRQARIGVEPHGVLAAAFVIALIVGGRRMWPAQRGALHYLPWLWVLGLPALLAARVAPIDSRQLTLVAPVATWLAWRAVEASWSGDRPTSRTAMRGALLGGTLAALMLVQEIAHYRQQVIPMARGEARELNASLVQWGSWLRRTAPPHATIATPQIGAIGYTSGLRVLDLTGLVSPEIAPLRDTHDDLARDLAFAPLARPEFLVDRRPSERLLAESPFRRALTPLREGGGWALYRIDWSVVDSLR